MTALPAHVRSAVQQLLEGRSRRALADRAQAASAGYRAGGGSAGLIRDEADVAAYLAARMPATFAAVAAAIGDIQAVAPDFAPHSLLDVACGPGTASFAALEAWPSIQQVTIVDANAAFLSAARHLAAAAETTAARDATIVQARVQSTTADLPEADLVMMAYALVEMPMHEVLAVATSLWDRCRGVLLLVEPGSREGFERIRRCRDALVQAGAVVTAPCTHDAACPMAAPDWCHFSQRLPRLRDHMIAKSANVPFEDEKHAYAAFARRAPEGRLAGRVLAPPKLSKARWSARVCADGAIAPLDVPRGDARYRRLKKVGWGDALGRDDLNPEADA